MLLKKSCQICARRLWVERCVELTALDFARHKALPALDDFVTAPVHSYGIDSVSQSTKSVELRVIYLLPEGPPAGLRPSPWGQHAAGLSSTPSASTTPFKHRVYLALQKCMRYSRSTPMSLPLSVTRSAAAVFVVGPREAAPIGIGAPRAPDRIHEWTCRGAARFSTRSAPHLST